MNQILDELEKEGIKNYARSGFTNIGEVELLRELVGSLVEKLEPTKEILDNSQDSYVA